jgi:hypothetical protein
VPEAIRRAGEVTDLPGFPVRAVDYEVTDRGDRDEIITPLPPSLTLARCPQPNWLPHIMSAGEATVLRSRQPGLGCSHNNDEAGLLAQSMQRQRPLNPDIALNCDNPALCDTARRCRPAWSVEGLRFDSVTRLQLGAFPGLTFQDAESLMQNIGNLPITVPSAKKSGRFSTRRAT